MTLAHTEEPSPQKPLRLWPGVAIAVVVALAKYVVPIFQPEFVPFGMLAGLLGWLAIVVWWAFFSRAPRLDRWLAVPLMVIALAATYPILDKSIATGMMGFMFPVFAIPVVGLCLVAGAVASRRLTDSLRRATMVAAILLGCGAWALLRTGGITSHAASDFAWRWAKTPEERLLAQAVNEPVALPAAAAVVPAAPAAVPAVVKTVAEWPGFRGPRRDGTARGVQIETDWTRSKPVAVWRRPVGPGWSSFAVQGDLIYTQEQRGEDEVVACYNATTGKPVWTHRDAARFWESNGGAGPRATPTLSNGRVYTCGATGIVNALDARDGAVMWSRNAASDTGTKIPGWGFASSPLVIDDEVVVATAGKLAAYDLATGKPRWFGPDGGSGYSSPHLMTIDGVAQIVLLNGAGAISVAPADGALMWKHAWPSDGIVQPARTADGDILIGTGSGMGDGAGMGVRRIAVTHGSGGWTVEERWTSKGLKPYFNDFVVHKGYAFGFDGSILACIDLKDGKRMWKGGRYGQGQLVLLPDQDLLLVLSEEGELALVAAANDQFKEIARIPAIEGKTWNHPALAGNVLLVRNDQEMAAFRLPRAQR